MCEITTLPNGTRVITCGRPHARRMRCVTCHGMADLLCDGPALPDRTMDGRDVPRTCDKPICRRHAVEIGPDKHLCNGCAEKRRMAGQS